MKFYTFGECPVCMTSDEDLLALVSKSDDTVFYYCPGCGLAWNEVPGTLDEMNGLDFYAPEGARAANVNDLARLGTSDYGATEIYDNFNEIL